MKQIKAKRISIALLTFITLHGLPAPVVNQRVVTAQQEEVAIITQLDGGVWLQRNKKPRLVKAAMLLNVGDVIKADNSGRAVIYQAYAPVNRLGANQSRIITKLSPPPPKDALMPEEYARLKRHLLNAQHRRNEKSPVTMGRTYDTVLTLSDMRNSTVLEREPTFNWTHVTGATSYVIKLYDSDEKIIWSANTTETRLDYPKNLPPLAPGDYKWEVTAQTDDRVGHLLPDWVLYDATAFTVVNKKRAEEIETDLARARSIVATDDGTANLVYISALIEHKRFPQAVAELKASLERAPKDQTLWELLMETYWRMKLWSARENARRLGKDPNLTVEMIRRLEARR